MIRRAGGRGNLVGTDFEAQKLLSDQILGGTYSGDLVGGDINIEHQKNAWNHFEQEAR